MGSLTSSTIDTINAAASAFDNDYSSSISSFSSNSPVQKKRWGGCWSQYWCFGSQKRIADAVIHPHSTLFTSTPSSSQQNQTSTTTPTTTRTRTRTRTRTSTTIILPFIAPPSSPASFLQSDPPSATLSPAPPSLPHQVMFTIGPYAHETQLVTPPAFSAFTTQPSTAPLTPPSESVQPTTPSSPDVPFAQLLTSSLERAARRNSGIHPKFKYAYPGSPGAQLISPASLVSNSGTSSPFPVNKLVQLRIGEHPTLYAFEHIGARKWGSRLASGSVTPDGVGLGSRLASGAVTPDGAGLGSRLGSGSLTPDCMVVPISEVGLILGNQVSEIASLANSETGSRTEENLVHHRVSFELSGEEVARYLERSCPFSESESANGFEAENQKRSSVVQTITKNHCGESATESPEKASGESEAEHSYKRHRSITFGSFKEFNFDSLNGEAPDKGGISSEWWTNETISGKAVKPPNNWSFFPLLQPQLN